MKSDAYESADVKEEADTAISYSQRKMVHGLSRFQQEVQEKTVRRKIRL